MYIAIQGQDIFKQRNIYHTERPKYHRLVVYFGRRADKMVQILNCLMWCQIRLYHLNVPLSYESACYKILLNIFILNLVAGVIIHCKAL